MSAKILDGLQVAAKIKTEVKGILASRKYFDHRSFDPTEDHWRELRPDYKYPCLAVVLASDDPASEIYVRRKQAACKEVGITSFVIRPFGDAPAAWESWATPQNHLLSTIDWLNQDVAVHGILVQLPLPGILNCYQVFDKINHLKDVDVFNPENVGLLLQGRPRFSPCTPAAVRELLVHHGIPIKGAKVCIINRSDVVGKPLHALLVQDADDANATVTVCHNHTPHELLVECSSSADIVVVAVGQPDFLREEMVKNGAVVVDVGINRIGSKVVGDVQAAVLNKAGWLSLVPGGVGPVTIACLLRNTVKAWQYGLSAAT